MAFEFNQIAAGHNNQDELERWSKLTGDDGCPLFQSYKKFIPMEWSDYESEEQAGNRLYIKIGLKNFAFVFPRITEEEDQKIRSMTTNGISGFVTITVYDRSDLTWKDFNATMVILSSNKNFNVESGEYENYRLEFYDLEEL